MKTKTKIQTIETTSKELSVEEVESFILSGLGIKREKGVGINIEFDISSSGFLRSVSVSTKKETESVS